MRHDLPSGPLLTTRPADIRNTVHVSLDANSRRGKRRRHRDGVSRRPPPRGRIGQSNPFTEPRSSFSMGRQLDCPVCRKKRSAASAIWIKSSAPRRCPSPRAAIASRRSRETTSGPSRANRSRANPSQNDSSSRLGTERRPLRSDRLPAYAGRGPEERMPANKGVSASDHLFRICKQCP